jgi:colanic acid/amylovoran biosynthesis glycosyltransferase
MTDRLKVAYYLHRFPHLTETFILREMIQLRAMGLDVQVFSMLPPVKTSTMHQQVQDMMPFVHYSPFLFSSKLIFAHGYFLLRSPLKYIRALWRAIWQTWPKLADFGKMLVVFPKAVYFARQIQEMEVDHIHAHFVWLNGIAAQIASDLTGVTYSLHAHAWDIFQRNRECIRHQLELATAIVTVSDYHRRYLADLCPRWLLEDIHVVHYGLDPMEFIPLETSTNGKVSQIISVGSLFVKKGHEYLIDACARLADKGFPFHCSIVGSGFLREALQAQIDERCLQDKVTLLGAKNQAEVLELYRHSDIFALPCVVSKDGDRDGMPNVLLEAMAMGLPVITTPVTGNPELVHDGETGLLVPERDSQALALALERLINDRTLRHKLGEQGRQTVLAGFDIHQTAAQMAIIFGRFRKSEQTEILPERQTVTL